MIALPTWPGPRTATPGVLDFGGILTPENGAATQRINRKGNRYKVAFAMPPLTPEQGRVWVNRLVRGQRQGARMEYPLLDFDPGTPGSFVVDGAGQSGTSLNIKGGTAGYQFKEGQPFNYVVDGQYFLDFIAADATADGAGDATITLSQMLRIEPADNDPLVIATPMVEGWVVGDQLAWELALERTVGLSFEIQEAR